MCALMLMKKSEQQVHGLREWVFSAIAHSAAEPVPYYFGFSPPIRAEMIRHYGCEDVEGILGIPIRLMALKSAKPLYVDSNNDSGETIKDEFGVSWSVNKIDRGAPVGPCLTAPDLEGYIFPEADAPSRFEDLEAWLQKCRNYFTVVWLGDFWERASFMRGSENLLLDLILNRKFVEELLERLCDYLLETMRILLERFDFDAIGLSDDYGTQQSMIISPQEWRRLIKPHLAKMFTLAKNKGRKILLHSDGNILQIIPDLIEIGVDLLHPIQPETMDIFQIKQQFGQDISLFGGLRTQDLLPRGTPEQIREEVRLLKQNLGRGGGFILAPANVIQADVPMENIIAMVEEAMLR